MDVRSIYIDIVKKRIDSKLRCEQTNQNFGEFLSV